MEGLDRAALDRHITGNYGEDQFSDEEDSELDGWFNTSQLLEEGFFDSEEELNKWFDEAIQETHKEYILSMTDEEMDEWFDRAMKGIPDDEDGVVIRMFSLDLDEDKEGELRVLKEKELSIEEFKELSIEELNELIGAMFK